MTVLKLHQIIWSKIYVTTTTHTVEHNIIYYVRFISLRAYVDVCNFKSILHLDDLIRLNSMPFYVGLRNLLNKLNIEIEILEIEYIVLD